MCAGAYDDTMLESWKGYHSQPAFIPGSEGDREGMPGPLNILHAPLERSPTINDRAASGTLMSINASMDLGSTFPPDGVQHPRPPSVGPPPTSTRARRLLHAITPGAKMQAAREQTLGLAFTDMIRAPPPMSMSRPLPSPPSGPGTVATARALKRSQTGNLWDGQQCAPHTNLRCLHATPADDATPANSVHWMPGCRIVSSSRQLRLSARRCKQSTHSHRVAGVRAHMQQYRYQSPGIGADRAGPSPARGGGA